MKSVIIMLAVLMVLTGCSQKELNKPALDTLDDVNYVVNEQGDLELKKTYNHEDGNATTQTESVENDTKKSTEKKYEIVPNFEKKYSTNLSLKKNENLKDKKIIVNGEKVKISVEAIPVNEFIDLVFSNVLKLNYTVDEEVRQLTLPITLNMTQMQPKQEVFDVVSKLLSLNGVEISKENGVLFLSKKDTTSVKTSTSGVYIGYGKKVRDDIQDDEKIIQIYPYKYIKPRDAISFIDFAGINTGLVSYTFPTKYTAMLKGKSVDVKKAMKIIELLDRPYLEDKISYLVELNNIEVDSFLTRIKEIFKTNSIPIGTASDDLGIFLTSIPEINTLLVVSSKQEWLDVLLYWKEKLDVKSEISQEPRFYTYKVKNRKADELAEVIGSVIDIKLSTSNVASIQKTSELKPSTTKENTKEKPPIKVGYKIQSDLPTNRLMMQLLPSEYREILPLIETLDALPLQVLAEVTLAEVTLTDNFSLGFEYALKNDAAAGSAALSTESITSAFGGSGFAATYVSKNLEVVMNAYAEKKLLSILSKPKILILNNETGSINVGSQIPVVTSESSATDIAQGTTPSILRNITYRTTGVSVGLSPTINSNGIVTMNVNLQLSEAQLNDTSGIDSPLLVNRTLSTTLTLKNGETVLLGGLISKNKSTTNSGVPYLMDIPWLGTLFQTQSEKIVKTELIMLIRPYIILTPTDMSDRTRKYRSLLTLLDRYSLF